MLMTENGVLKKLFLVCLVVFCCAIYGEGQKNADGQEKFDWAKKIENAIKEAMPGLELSNVDWWDKEGTWRQYSFRTNVKAGGHVEINELVNVSNVEDSFQQFAKIYDDLGNSVLTRRDIKDYGEEGFVWVLKKDNEWSKLFYRRKKFTVEITYPEELSRKLAKLIDDQLPR